MVGKIDGFSSSPTVAATPREKQDEPKSARPPSKPFLPPPSNLESFTLCFLLNKLEISQESRNGMLDKQELDAADRAKQIALQNKIQDRLKEEEARKENERWGVAVKVFSWIGSMISIIAGITMVASGVGALAGSLLIGGGVITLTSSILEITGGWQKIAQLIPSNDPEERRAIVSWIQIATTFLSLALSCVGIVMGGFSAAYQNIQQATYFMSAIALIGGGVSQIGKGINENAYMKRRAQVKKDEIELVEIRHKRDDIVERMELSIERLENMYKLSATALGLKDSVARAQNKAWRN